MNEQTDITYAESRGKIPFDWNKFLEKEHKSEEEWRQARMLAQSWVTCAVGNQCSVIPRSKGLPDDYDLRKLGRWFLSDIEHYDSLAASDTLHKIEKRSAELIAQIKGE